MKKFLLALTLLTLSTLSFSADTTLFQFPPTGFPCVFNGTVPAGSPGANPLTYHAGLLYGTTPGDAAAGGNCGSAGMRGSVFSYDPVANVFTVLTTMGTGTPPSATILDHPSGPVWVDLNLNIYGTSEGSTLIGEGNGAGCFWELPYDSVHKTYAAQPTVIWTFAGGSGGSGPRGGVVLDFGLNAYGVTSGGGQETSPCPSTGCGVVYRFIRNGSGYTTPPVISHTFNNVDGASPTGSTIVSSFTGFENLNQFYLYGTAQNGGSSNLGTAWMMEVGATGDSNELFVLHNFTGGSTDGANPIGGLYFTQSGGGLLGTTLKGGSGTCSGGCGTVFQMSGPDLKTETVVHMFPLSSLDVQTPQGAVIADAAGNLYGTGSAGGGSSDGGIFLLSLNSDATYTESLLDSLAGGSGGQTPASAVAIGGTTLYGITALGGANSCDGHGCGVIFSNPE